MTDGRAKNTTKVKNRDNLLVIKADKIEKKTNKGDLPRNMAKKIYQDVKRTIFTKRQRETIAKNISNTRDRGDLSGRKADNIY